MNFFADLRPKGRGRPQRILLGVWPDEHIRGVIRAVVFRDSHQIKEEPHVAYPRIHVSTQNFRARVYLYETSREAKQSTKLDFLKFKNSVFKLGLFQHLNLVRALVGFRNKVTLVKKLILFLIKCKISVFYYH